MKVFAIDDLIVNEGASNSDADAISILRQATGLAESQAHVARRYGRRPVVAGLERTARQDYLETWFLGSDWKANKKLLYQYLNTDQETLRRLTAMNAVPAAQFGKDVLLAFGPWDVYADAGGDWHVRSLLLPEIEADLSGAVHFLSGEMVGESYGEQARALVIEEPTLNRVLNPVAGGTGNFYDAGNWAVTRSTDVYLFDHMERKSYKVVSTGVGSLILTLSALLNNIHYISFWLYGEIPSGATLRIKIGATGDYATTVIGTAGDWTRYGAQVTAGDANGATTVAIEQSGVGSGTFYLDGIQVEKRNYFTTTCWGGAGKGYSWSGTEHASYSEREYTRVNLNNHVDLISENDTLTFHLVVRVPYDAGTMWDLWSLAYLLNILPSSGTVLGLVYEGITNKFAVYLGGVTYYGLTQTWSAGDWLPITLVLDFNGEMRLWIAGQQELCVDISAEDMQSIDTWTIGGSSVSFYSKMAFAEFVVYDRALTCAEVQRLHAEMGARETRWVNVQAEQVQPRTEGGRRLAFATVATLVIDGDTRWQSRDGDYAPWRVYDEESSLLVDVDSDDEVYPEIRITPKVAKTGGFLYKRWCPVVWKMAEAYTNYPLCLEPSSLGSHVQVSGNDLRVYADGAEIDRWLLGSIPSAMQIWINLSFEPAPSMTLVEAIAGSGAVEEIQINGSIANLPSTGILLIGSEAFIYTNKSTAKRTFTGIARGVRDTSEVAHSEGDTIYWVQHDLWLFYGDASLGVPDVDDDYAPVFIYRPIETGDDSDLLGGWGDVTGATTGNTDDGILYVIVVNDGSASYHVELYKDYGCASGDLVGHTASYSTTGDKAITPDNASGLGGTLLVEVVAGHPVTETGDGNNRLSGWGNLTDVTPANTDGGALYVSLVYAGSGNYRVDLYKDAGKAGGDKVGHTADYSTTGAKTITADNGSGIGGTVTVDSVSLLVESGDDNNCLSGWDNITGITASNTLNGVLYVSIIYDGGGNYHVDLFKDGARAAGDKVGHTAGYSTTGNKAIVADNSSGLGGTVTVDVVSAFVESGDTYNELSGWENITGISTNNTTNGTLYAAVVDEGSGNYRVELYSDVGHTALVGHTASYSTTGAKAITADNSSGLGGTITVDAVQAATPDENDPNNILSGWDGVLGLINTNTDNGTLYVLFTRSGSNGKVEFYTDAGYTNKVAHAGWFQVAGSKTLTADGGSGISGTITVDQMYPYTQGIEATYHFAIEASFYDTDIKVSGFEFDVDIQAIFAFTIEVEFPMVSGDSDNSQWTFAQFGEDDGLRSGAWQCNIDAKTGSYLGRYTGDYATEPQVNPWAEIGLDLASTWKYWWFFYNPCGITNANFEDGEYKASHADREAVIASSADGVEWAEEHDINPAGTGVWTNWNQDVGLSTGSKYVRMLGQALMLECDKVTLTLNPANIPSVIVNDEQNSYVLACTIENETTGQAITLLVGIEVDTVLIVNTNDKTIRLADGTSLFYALTTDTARRDWLRLVPGENELTYEETGAVEVEIDILWNRRRFE